MLIFIKNTSIEEKVWSGQTVQPSQYYLIEKLELQKWQNNSQLMVDISSGIAVVAKSDDGAGDLIDVAQGINYLLVSDPDEPRSSITGVQRVAVEKPDIPSTSITSHDFCDPCTWFTKSVRVEGQTLTLETGKTYGSPSTKWIDLTHGRVTDEDDFAENYVPVIYDNGVALVEDLDFTINYLNGKVTFAENYIVQGTITADFSHATSSHFVLEPIAGKTLIIEHAELNFSKDCSMNTPISFEIWVGNQLFNPQEPESPTNPLRVLYKKKRYKNEKDLINAANLGQGEIAQWGNLPHPVIVFPFNYVTLQPMRSSQLTQLIIHLDNDTEGNQVPLQGSWGTSTFYVMSIPDLNYS